MPPNNNSNMCRQVNSKLRNPKNTQAALYPVDHSKFYRQWQHLKMPVSTDVPSSQCADCWWLFCWSCPICRRRICSMVGLFLACWALIWRANCGRCSSASWGVCCKSCRESPFPLPSSTVSVIFCNILNDFDWMGGERGSLQVDIGVC